MKILTNNEKRMKTKIKTIKIIILHWLTACQTQLKTIINETKIHNNLQKTKTTNKKKKKRKGSTENINRL